MHYRSKLHYVKLRPEEGERPLTSLKELTTLGQKATALKAADAYAGATEFIPLSGSSFSTLNDLEASVLKEYGGTMKQGGNTYNIRRVSGR